MHYLTNKQTNKQTNKMDIFFLHNNFLHSKILYLHII